MRTSSSFVTSYLGQRYMAGFRKPLPCPTCFPRSTTKDSTQPLQHQPFSGTADHCELWIPDPVSTCGDCYKLSAGLPVSIGPRLSSRLDNFELLRASFPMWF